MAGNYPDVPDHRIEYDRDGTAVTIIDHLNVVSEMTLADKQKIADEDADDPLSLSNIAGYGSQNVRKLVFIFPELRDIAGYFFAGTMTSGPNGTPGVLDKSTDTTNGLDGTWSNIVNPYVASTADSAAPKPYFRSAIQGISASGVKAVRFNQTWGGSGASAHSVHLYGHITTGQTKYLTIWRPNTAAGGEDTGDSAADGSHLDWGDVPRSSSADRKFRVKNEHATLTANSIALTVEALTDTTPTVPGQFLLSTDGTNFSASVNIGNLAPGALSGEIWVRRTTPANAILSVWSARIVADATSWS